MWFWKTKTITEHELEITASIKALKTLTFSDGRVSISPSEVLDQPGYLSDRARAGALVRDRAPFESTAPSRFQSSTLADSIAHSLALSRRDGLTLDEAIDALHRSLKTCPW